jgi:hypothetical protein
MCQRLRTERVLDGIRRWVDLYGEPPSAADWDPYHARRLGDEARAARYEEGDWPHMGTAFNAFGSWNAAIEAAGFKARAPHGGAGNQWRRRGTERPVRSAVI